MSLSEDGKNCYFALPCTALQLLNAAQEDQAGSTEKALEKVGLFFSSCYAAALPYVSTKTDYFSPLTFACALRVENDSIII